MIVELRERDKNAVEGIHDRIFGTCLPSAKRVIRDAAIEAKKAGFSKLHPISLFYVLLKSGDYGQDARRLIELTGGCVAETLAVVEEMHAKRQVGANVLRQASSYSIRSVTPIFDAGQEAVEYMADIHASMEIYQLLNHIERKEMLWLLQRSIDELALSYGLLHFVSSELPNLLNGDAQRAQCRWDALMNSVFKLKPGRMSCFIAYIVKIRNPNEGFEQHRVVRIYLTDSFVHSGMAAELEFDEWGVIGMMTTAEAKEHESIRVEPGQEYIDVEAKVGDQFRCFINMYNADGSTCARRHYEFLHIVVAEDAVAS